MSNIVAVRLRLIDLGYSKRELGEKRIRIILLLRTAAFSSAQILLCADPKLHVGHPEASVRLLSCILNAMVRIDLLIKPSRGMFALSPRVAEKLIEI